MEKCLDSLETAKRESDLNPAASIARSYYACFYAASAVLILQGRKFVKHAGVESALNRYLVREGLISKDLGNLYRKLMESRNQADYEAMISWTPSDAHTRINHAESIIDALKKLIPGDLIPHELD
jgi:uncharacterized protein